jgi:hypothetical protein
MPVTPTAEFFSRAVCSKAGMSLSRNAALALLE